MGQQLEIAIDASADECFARFCEVERLPEWVPGLKSAEILWRHPTGLPAEARFHSEVGDQVEEYVLLYSYDPATRRLVWHPVEAGPYLVRGFATFEDEGGRCRMRYVLELGDDANKVFVLARAQTLLNAFRDWMTDR